ncbi:MAG: imidazole glycerol phosphate synthase subunit HisH [Puniceicoccales bacterium]|jgi:glutamine amidotransferase|nr:imidazole glycerol phosphate synthase subunit HisH [Puniceicoccales bacterium]
MPDATPTSTIAPNATAASATPRVPVAVIDYGMGNLRSVARALEHCGAVVTLAARPADIPADARALVFPGQGAIVDCMDCLSRTGFDGLIREWIAADRPFFGVCLGLQALFGHSEEGNCEGLGIFPGVVRRFPRNTALKVPHMGWNTVDFRAGAPLAQGLRASGEAFYFVHSYHLAEVPPGLVWCETEYGFRFASGIWRGNCFATQYHPEKSQSKGLQLYRNFLTHAAAL